MDVPDTFIKVKVTEKSYYLTWHFSHIFFKYFKVCCILRKTSYALKECSKSLSWQWYSIPSKNFINFLNFIQISLEYKQMKT